MFMFGSFPSRVIWAISVVCFFRLSEIRNRWRAPSRRHISNRSRKRILMTHNESSREFVTGKGKQKMCSSEVGSGSGLLSLESNHKSFSLRLSLSISCREDMNVFVRCFMTSCMYKWSHQFYEGGARWNSIVVNYCQRNGKEIYEMMIVMEDCLSASILVKKLKSSESN